LKKRSKKLLCPQPLPDAGQFPYRGTGAGIKSLLVLFFRKELASCAASAGCWQHRAILLVCLLVATLPVLCGHVRYGGSDAKGVTVVAQQLLADGTVSLKGKQLSYFAAGDPCSDRRIDRRLIVQNGRTLYYYPIGSALVALPFVAVENLFGVAATDRKADWKLQQKLVLATAAIVVAMFYKLLRGGFGPGTSMALATMFFYGTLLAPTIAGAFWSVDCEILCTGLVIALVWRGAHPIPRMKGIALGALLFLGFLCRPTFAAIVLPMFVYLGIRDRRGLVLSACASGLLLMAFIGFSEMNYGSFLPPYYLASRLSPDHAWSALIGLLVSPSRGVLVFCPFLILLVVFVPFVRRVGNPVLMACLSAAMLLQFASNVFFPHWTGGVSYGPRILANFVFAGCVISIALLQAMPVHAARAAQWCLVGTLLVGMAINLPGLISSYTMLWNEFPPVDAGADIVFDWRFPQFLAVSRRALQEKYYAQSGDLIVDGCGRKQELLF